MTTCPWPIRINPSLSEEEYLAELNELQCPYGWEEIDEANEIDHWGGLAAYERQMEIEAFQEWNEPAGLR